MLPRQIQRYQQIVDQFIEVASANLETAARITDLCDAAGISQRTLSRAFRAILDTTPSHHFHALRLEQVRLSLLSAHANNQTVTQAAMRFGFQEFGRFAKDYRATFGESPSDTLRRANVSSVS